MAYDEDSDAYRTARHTYLSMLRGYGSFSDYFIYDENQKRCAELNNKLNELRDSIAYLFNEEFIKHPCYR